MTSRFSRLHEKFADAIRTRLGPTPAKLAESAERPWASITFSGARHLFTFRLIGPAGWDAACAFATHLDDMDFSLRGALVADMAVQALTRTPDGGADIQLEALTVDA